MVEFQRGNISLLGVMTLILVLNVVNGQFVSGFLHTGSSEIGIGKQSCSIEVCEWCKAVSQHFYRWYRLYGMVWGCRKRIKQTTAQQPKSIQKFVLIQTFCFVKWSSYHSEQTWWLAKITQKRSAMITSLQKKDQFPSTFRAQHQWTGKREVPSFRGLCRPIECESFSNECFSKFPISLLQENWQLKLPSANELWDAEQQTCSQIMILDATLLLNLPWKALHTSCQ